jgi:hypothetical protein
MCIPLALCKRYIYCLNILKPTILNFFLLKKFIFCVPWKTSEKRLTAFGQLWILVLYRTAGLHLVNK